MFIKKFFYKDSLIKNDFFFYISSFFILLFLALLTWCFLPPSYLHESNDDIVYRLLISGELLQNVYTKGLNNNWFESKRANYWEVSGVLEARFSGGSTATLHSEESNKTVLITILNNLSWKINEAEGIAKRSDGIAINGNLNFQSEMTSSLIQSILDKGSCELPLLEESTELHRVFIRSMHQHWKNTGNPTATFVPIT